MSKRRTVGMVAVCAALLLEGCAFRRLGGDLKVIESLKVVSGVIAGEVGDGKPVVVVLWSLDDAGPSGYSVGYRGGEFRFVRRSGRYYLLAFEDLDEDAAFQKGEPVGMFGDPTAIDLDSTAGLEGLVIELDAASHDRLPPAVLGHPPGRIEGRFSWRKELAGSLTGIDNPAFSDESGLLGLWTPTRFVEQIGLRIYFLEPYDEGKIPVLFVHGSSGHPAQWAQAVESLDRTRFQPWLAFYPSGLRLATLGNALAQHLDELHLRHRFKDLFVVAHSMGGLVSRAMILDYASSPNRCAIPLFVSISTPWAGHPGARMGVDSAPAVVPAWYDMVPGSPFQVELLATPLPPETEFRLFFSYRGKPGMHMGSENNDGTVPLGSQLFLSAQEAASQVRGFDAGHVEILADENALQKLNNALRERAESRSGTGR